MWQLQLIMRSYYHGEAAKKPSVPRGRSDGWLFDNQPPRRFRKVGSCLDKDLQDVAHIAYLRKTGHILKFFSLLSEFSARTSSNL